MNALCKLFQAPVAEMGSHEERVYASFSRLSRTIQTLRENGLPGGEASRCNQFLSKMLLAFESVKHIYQYRTPRTLRAYSKLFIFLLPVLYGPYFAEISIDRSLILSFIMPILFSVVLVSLDYIQDHLENPFDQIGEDDIKICVVLKPGEELSPEQLLDYCQEHMPYFAVPRYVEFMDQLPKTQTDKVQKHKLRDAGITPATWDREKTDYLVRKG